MADTANANNAASASKFADCTVMEPCPKVKVHMCKHEDGSHISAKLVVEKGWKWSEHMKPALEAKSQPLHPSGTCPKEHHGICLKGKLKVTMDDGKVLEISEGMAYHIPPGHDAECIEDCEACEFAGAPVGMTVAK